MKSFVFIVTLAVLLTTAVGELSENRRLFIEGNDDFNAKFFDEVLKSNGQKSIITSAFSVEYPLGQLLFGARGSTENELSSIIRLNQTQAAEVYPDITNQLKAARGVEINIGTKVYLNQNYELSEDFQDKSRNVFNSEVDVLDTSKPVEAANAVNSWVESATNQRIKNLVSSQDVTEALRVMLVNTIYFKGTWQRTFKTRLTQDREFYISETDTIMIPTMSDQGKYLYAESEELGGQVLQMNYEGNSCSMTLLLPSSKTGLQELAAKLLDTKLLNNTLGSLAYNEVQVYLPKFTIETTIDMKDVLPKVGVSEIFDMSKADLSGIVEGEARMVVTQAKQTAFIDVNETGTEAAAANVVGISLTSALITPEDPKIFKADRPFIFLLKFGDITMFQGAFFQ